KAALIYSSSKHYCHFLTAYQDILEKRRNLMKTPNLVLIYVDDPMDSASFYQRLFERNPTAAFPTFVAFTFEEGLTVALWSKKANNFLSDGEGHRFELAFMVDDENQVRALRDRWASYGVSIEQDLHEAVFG